MKIDSDRIEILLAERGMTKSDLAKKSGISRQSVSTIIRRGTCEPRSAGKLANGLHVGIGEITKK